MRRSPTRLPLVLFARMFLPACALLLLGGPAMGQASEDPVVVRQRELRDLKRLMEENRSKIEELRRKEKNLGDLDGRLRRDRELTERYLGRLEEQERALLGDLGQRQGELDEMMLRQEEKSALMRRRLRAYQRARRPQLGELLFSSKNFSELFARGTALARAIQRDRGELATLQGLRADLETATSLLESRHRGLESLQEEKIRERFRLEKRSEQARHEIERVRTERARHEAHQKELVESEKRIRALIAQLEEERRRRRDEGGALVAGPGLSGRRGSLPWPLSGEVIGRFGVESHPRFGTKVPSNGIDIRAPAGTPVRAIAPGVAEFVDWLPGYGRCVIVNHGGGYYSLYAHCSRVRVAKGARVAEGEAIAEVGDTDSLKGTCLHFEIRNGPAAEDPQAWLR